MNAATLTVVPQGASTDDVLVARIRSAWTRAKNWLDQRSEWIEATLELAQALAEARKGKSDQDFSRWLERNGFAEISKDDRAALLGMAKDLVVTRKVLEKTDRTSWQHIWKNDLQKRVRHVTNPRQAIGKRKSKTERQLIDKVLNLNGRGFSYDETAAELGLTKGQVAGIVFRNGNTNNKPPPPPPKRWEGPGLDSKALTREQVDPDFKGTAIEFATKYGHVLLHTKAEIEENKRQEVLSAWLAAVTDHQRTGQVLANAEVPHPDTLRQWLAKPGKAERLRTWLVAIETAYHSIVPCLKRVKEPA